MSSHTSTILACTCADSVPVDVAALRRAFPQAHIETLRACSGADLERMAKLGANDLPLAVACTCRTSAMADMLEETGRPSPAAFVNIRETAGWSRESKAATPKMAALIALALEPAADVPMLSLESGGVTIVYGRDDVAITVAKRLADDLDITVLLTERSAIAPPREAEFPIFAGKIRAVTGHLGAFDLKVDGFAEPSPASRGALRFGPARNGTSSQCDLILDLSGGTPLFPAADLRPGYLRADPRDGAAVERLIAEARDLTGTFDKPRYVTFRADLCAHSRSKITGCTRCMDVCPTGAITPDGDAVAIDPAICAGCGGCGAVCPTGAASYALPAPDMAMQRLRAMLGAYHAAGGSAPVMLVHDGEHGADMIHALAHHGDGLPARALPFPVNETTQLGLEWFAAAFAYGAAAVRILTRGKPRHDETALIKTRDLSSHLLTGLGFGADAVAIVSADDPDVLGAALWALSPGIVVKTPAGFLPTGGKRQVQRLALRELQAVAPAPAATIALPQGAPMGRVIVDVAGCTLCHACVSACPANALTANPDRPELRFAEDLCVQCGLCARTCPEQVISLEPRIDFAAIEAPPILLKGEDPHACERCGKLFGTKATVAKIREKLAGKHWMFAGPNADRAALIGLCDDCRVISATERAIDPYAGTERPRPRTADDYRKSGDQED